MKLFGEYSDFIALQKFLRHNFTKVQVPWVKDTDFENVPWCTVQFLSKKTKSHQACSHFIFFKIKTNHHFRVLFFTKIWSNAKEHFSSQYFNSKDLNFKNLASKFSKWLEISNLMPCPSVGPKQFWTSPYCFGQVQKDFQFGHG